MPSYNYYGQNYANPYLYPVYQQPAQTAQAPQQTQQTVQPMNTPSIIWISSENEALSYPVAPNNAVTLWSTSEPVVYLKQADATGKPTLKTYDLVERTQAVSTASASQGGNTVIYAKKDDLDAVLGVIKGISNDVEQMKGDLYGMTGRRKTSGRKPKIDDGEDEE